MTVRTRTLYRGTVEYLECEVVADAELDTQDVDISLDGGTTWTAAEWFGDAGTTRSARILLDTADMDEGKYTVYVRVALTPEVPISHAGTVRIA